MKKIPASEEPGYNNHLTGAQNRIGNRGTAAMNRDLNLRLMLSAVMLAILSLPVASFAQAGSTKSKSSKPVEVTSISTPDPAHDLSGVYEFFVKGIPDQGFSASLSASPPTMTPWAQERYNSAKPAFGPKATMENNDPVSRCIPSGFPRILLWPEPVEIVQTPDRIFMFFEHERVWRQIWIDGRSHPRDLEPTWMGDSIGKWDGDTLIVDTIGLNSKSWLDSFGHPHSEEAHVIERYRHPNSNSLTLQYSVDDPKAYKWPWRSDTKIYTLLRNERAEIEERFCIPEEDAFKKNIREPAAGKPAN
jgi:hypothetical protein